MGEASAGNGAFQKAVMQRKSMLVVAALVVAALILASQGHVILAVVIGAGSVALPMIKGRKRDNSMAR
jgi:hypothetical protein